MADPWLEPAELIGCTKGGGSYDGSPVRLVLHTVEGDPGSVDGCRSLAEGHDSPPQLWYHPRLRWLGQGIPLDRSGYALAHPSGTPETNKAGALQVEIFGFAADTPGWTDELDNIGADVVRPILDAGWPVDTGWLAPTTGSDGYGTDGAVRGSWDQWAPFAGICCHSNVPGQDHWDAGDLDLGRIVRAAGAGPTLEPIPEPEDSDMATLTICAAVGSPVQYVTDLCTFKTPIENDAAWSSLVWCTIAAGGKLYYQDINDPVRVPAELLDPLPVTAAR